jgi:hypothetical protein
MEDSFQKHGDSDLSLWTQDLLDDIDHCFVKNYMENGKPASCLFFPDSPDNINRFSTYCGEVDQALRRHSETAPRYAREYFLYYSIWQMRGWRFPMPLGTASVVGVLNSMVMKVEKGFMEVGPAYYDFRPTRTRINAHNLNEVISWIATSVSWSPRFNAKVFISRDQFDTMVDTLSEDPLLNKTHQGIRRKVCLFPLPHSSLNPRTRRQIFSIFFSHLTTVIVEINIYLKKNPTRRDGVPKDLLDFKKLAEDVAQNSTSTKKDKCFKDWPEKEKDETNKAYAEKLSGVLDAEHPGERTVSDKFIRGLDWNLVKYAYEWRTNAATMKLKSFNRDQRVSERTGERLLVMSGLSWNVDSHHASRDWTNIIAAVTLETALVESYRARLLIACPGACALRKEMHKYILSITSPHHKNSSTGKLETVTEWEFPDGIPLDVGTCDGRSYDPDEIRKELYDDGDAKPKGKRNSAATAIDGLCKNKLLWSSDPNAAQGTLETLAYQSISTLSRVSHTFNPRVCVPWTANASTFRRLCILTSHG